MERGVERDDQRRRGWPRDPSTRATPESLHPVRIEGSEEGKTGSVLGLADPIHVSVFTYVRTYREPKNTVGETSYGIIEHHWLLPGR